ncbi:MAG: Fic family protein [Candidatus Thiodiazotropha sp. (ex Troendleina suluensis)]|nr:Fic family protein [Candidatus Thiodiazotropha sp. (ex Troendleina suluensis)]
MADYQPPFTLTRDTVSLVAEISERVGRLSIQLEQESQLRLRRINRIRTVTGSLAIEGNTLSEAQITAILDGKRVIAPPREIQEASNALAAYEQLPQWDPQHENDLRVAHRVLMLGLMQDTGVYRLGGAGVMAGDRLLHMAPSANQVPRLMKALFGWLGASRDHPLIVSSVFHYEFEFIHPFADGNGRMGRLWQTLMLSRWQPLFANLPVESLVHQHQSEYYQAINQSTAQSDSAPFITFMLTMIRDALESSATPQVAPQVSPQVAALLGVLSGAMSREQLQAALGLADRKSFRVRYLLPALAAGWIEMTIPDKPQSRMQQYRLSEAGRAVLGEIEPVTHDKM